MKKIVYLSCACLLAVLVSSCSLKKSAGSTATNQQYPKREFRGAWIHTVGQGQYKNMNSKEMKEYFVSMLDQLQKAGINAVVFQVRPQADAFYNSKFEPWSMYLTGEQGKPMDGGFDPLAFMIDECHKRNMELHAWMNPYRVTSSENQKLVSNHIYNRHPERFVKYGKQLYFDPGIPENRVFICDVVKDIVSKYAVDAIHMDDYFYPYPIAGEDFPDSKSFGAYGALQGFSPSQKHDWRRNNVNMLIKEIKETILSTKPWVRFGVSPFGIYRNKKSTPDGSGSETNGLQNYDELFADVKLWAENGWVDYNIPQLYWEIGHKAADYKTLNIWWAKNSWGQHLYIGQSVRRTMDAKDSKGRSQLDEKMVLSRSFPTINGNCFWPGYDLLKNVGGITDELIANYHKYPALIPAYTNLYGGNPDKVKKLKSFYTTTQHILTWERADKDAKDPVNAQYFVVYRFGKGEKVDLNRAQNILATTRSTEYVLPYEGGNSKYTYVVTSVDAFHNESKGQSIKVTL